MSTTEVYLKRFLNGVKKRLAEPDRVVLVRGPWAYPMLSFGHT